MISESKFEAAVDGNNSRVIEPELLDELPANDPRAVRSRYDLRRVNFWMGHAGIIAKTLERAYPVLSQNHCLPHGLRTQRQRPLPSGERIQVRGEPHSLRIPSDFGNKPDGHALKTGAFRRIVELGCGDGTLLLKIARRLPEWRDVDLALVDQQKLVSDQTIAEFNELGWHARNIKADVSDWLEQREVSDCIMANLFLHHFRTEQLESFFQLAAEQTNLFVACEPRRSQFARFESRLLGLIGCSAVTLHDAEISIRAGFHGDELSKLWPREGWRLTERSAGLFSHLFVAEKFSAGGQ